MKPKTVTFTKDSINLLLNEYNYIGEALQGHDSVLDMFYVDKNKVDYKKIIEKMLKTLSTEPTIKNIEVKTRKLKNVNREVAESITVTIAGLMAIYIVNYKIVEHGNIGIKMTIDFIDTDDKESPYLTNNFDHLIV